MQTQMQNMHLADAGRDAGLFTSCCKFCQKAAHATPTQDSHKLNHISQSRASTSLTAVPGSQFFGGLNTNVLGKHKKYILIALADEVLNLRKKYKKQNKH